MDPVISDWNWRSRYESMIYEGRGERPKCVYTCIFIHACCLVCLLNERAWEQQHLSYKEQTKHLNFDF